MSKFYLTTPIYYINGLPHIGHAYCSIAADAIARYHRQQGEEVMFSAGVDENGQKIVQAAKKAGQKPMEFADSMAEAWQTTWAQLGISHDRFIRTTEPRHKKGVYDIIAKVKARGDIYRDSYEGLYCVGHEAFVRPEELVEGKCLEHGTVPEKVKEDNYFFKLSRYQQPLLDYIAKHPKFIQPESRRNEVVAFIKRGLEDLSVSRKSADWGIRWPDDDTQAVYVWFDALTNYLTVIDYPHEDYKRWWPADVHLVGKDISRFHCVYWPAMLMSAGLELPKQVFVHGFFTLDGQKISKSLSNAINPVELAGKYGVDALRFYLMREISFGGDGEFSQTRFHEVYTTELANELGNAVQRVASMITRYLGGTIGELPKASHDVGLYHRAMGELRLDRALEELWVHVRGVNQYIDEEKPWELATKDRQQLVIVLEQAVADLLHVAGLLTPFIPATAQRIVQTFADGRVHPEVGILFPKFDQPARVVKE